MVLDIDPSFLRHLALYVYMYIHYQFSRGDGGYVQHVLHRRSICFSSVMHSSASYDYNLDYKAIPLPLNCSVYLVLVMEERKMFNLHRPRVMKREWEKPTSARELNLHKLVFPIPSSSLLPVPFSHCMRLKHWLNRMHASLSPHSILSYVTPHQCVKAAKCNI